ncbi:MAG TPA: SLATT domain-containing protein [Thermoanaerobaculia bacterium]
MSTNDKLTFLRDAIAERGKALNDRAAANRQRGFRMKMLVTGLSAFTTVVLGLKGFNSAWSIGIQNVALVSSALVSMFAAWDAFFNYRANWLVQQSTVGLLKELEKDLQYLSAGGEGPLDETKLDELYERYRQIMTDYNAAWAQLKRASSSQTQLG